jgi:hypothetical protein
LAATALATSSPGRCLRITRARASASRRRLSASSARMRASAAIESLLAPRVGGLGGCQRLDVPEAEWAGGGGGEGDVVVRSTPTPGPWGPDDCPSGKWPESSCPCGPSARVIARQNGPRRDRSVGIRSRRRCRAEASVWRRWSTAVAGAVRPPSLVRCPEMVTGLLRRERRGARDCAAVLTT